MFNYWHVKTQGGQCSMLFLLTCMTSSKTTKQVRCKAFQCEREMPGHGISHQLGSHQWAWQISLVFNPGLPTIQFWCPAEHQLSSSPNICCLIPRLMSHTDQKKGVVWEWAQCTWQLLQYRDLNCSLATVEIVLLENDFWAPCLQLQSLVCFVSEFVTYFQSQLCPCIVVRQLLTNTN